MSYINVDKFAEAICNFKQIDEDAANAMIWLLRTFPTADVLEVRHEILDEATRVHSVGEHCLKIYRGELPDSECLNCAYKHLGVDCVLALIEAQHKIITEILEETNDNTKITGDTPER